MSKEVLTSFKFDENKKELTIRGVLSTSVLKKLLENLDDSWTVVAKEKKKVVKEKEFVYIPCTCPCPCTPPEPYIAYTFPVIYEDSGGNGCLII